MILLECTVGLRDGDRKKLQEQLTAEIGQPVVILPSSILRAKERNILFLCDRKGLREMQLSTVQAYAGAGTRQKFCTSRIYEAHGRRVGRAGGRNDGREDRPGQT